MPKYVISVETYSEENEEGPALIQGQLHNLVNGYKLFTIECETEDVKEKTIELLKHALTLSPEFLKRTFPNFYRVSLTKQYWFHLLEKDFIGKHQLKDNELEEKEVSLEDHLEHDSVDDGGLIDTVDVFFDRDLNELNGPPERINFWEMMGLEDIAGD